MRPITTPATRLRSTSLVHPRHAESTSFATSGRSRFDHHFTLKTPHSVTSRSPQFIHNPLEAGGTLSRKPGNLSGVTLSPHQRSSASLAQDEGLRYNRTIYHGLQQALSECETPGSTCTNSHPSRRNRDDLRRVLLHIPPHKLHLRPPSLLCRRLSRRINRKSLCHSAVPFRAAISPG